MYRWYQEAKVCFVLLSDVKAFSGPEALRTSKYFTRAWTLQEMLAPTNLEFFDTDWTSLGTFSDDALANTVSEVTRVPLGLLRKELTLSDFSVAQRFSWAAKRESTRVEDKAYSLLGLFNVHLSLLYGEGEKAFERLQLELIRSSSDHTFFCWKDDTETFVHHLLAPSVSCFADAGNILSLATAYSRSFAVTNQGLEITLPVHYYLEAGPPGRTYGLLRCTDSSHLDKRYVLLLERKWSYDANEANYSDPVSSSTGDHLKRLPDGRIFDERHVTSFARRIFTVGHHSSMSRLDMTNEPLSDYRLQSIIIWRRPVPQRNPDVSLKIEGGEVVFFPYSQRPRI